MIIRRKITRLLAVTLILSCLMTALIPAAFAAESRASTNGYSYTNVTYNGKTYTISLGVGGAMSKVAYVTAHCNIADILISIDGVTVKFDTYNYGYLTERGSGKTERTFAKDELDNNPSYNHFDITSPTVTCSKGTGQVIKVMEVSSRAVFYSVNNGQNVSLSVSYTG